MHHTRFSAHAFSHESHTSGPLQQVASVADREMLKHTNGRMSSGTISMMRSGSGEFHVSIWMSHMGLLGEMGRRSSVAFPAATCSNIATVTNKKSILFIFLKIIFVMYDCITIL